MDCHFARLTIRRANAVLSACFIVIFGCVSDTPESREAGLRFSFEKEADKWLEFFAENSIDQYPLVPLSIHRNINFFNSVEYQINEKIELENDHIIYVRQNIDNGILEVAILVQGKSGWALFEWTYPSLQEEITQYYYPVRSVNSEIVNKNGFLLYKFERIAIGSSSYYIFYRSRGTTFRIAACCLPREQSTISDINEILNKSVR